MKTQVERPRYTPDYIPDKDPTQVPDDRFSAVNQREGIAAVDPVNLDQARQIVMTGDAAASDASGNVRSDVHPPVNPDAYLPPVSRNREVPMPRNLLPKQIFPRQVEISNVPLDNVIQEEDEIIDEVIDEVIDETAQPAAEVAEVQAVSPHDTARMPVVEQAVAPAEFKIPEPPAEIVTSETAPAIARWYDQIFDQAVKYLDAARGYFKPTAELTEQLQALREERRKLHEAATNMFSDDQQVRNEAIKSLLDSELHLAGNAYRLEKYLTQGGFGATFVARDQNNAECIVKISKPFDRSKMFYKDISPTHEESDQATVPRSAIVEVAALDRLTKLGADNPGPALIDAQFAPHPDNMNQRVSIIVMARVRGVSLRAFDAQQVKEPLLVVDAISQIVDKLRFVHKQGLIHGDIKQNNVLVDREGDTVTAKLIDFGATIIESLRAKQNYNNPKRAEPTRWQRLLGKKPVQPPVYAQEASILVSPSYVNTGEPATKARDRYSLGRSIQIMLFGKDFMNPVRMKELMPGLPFPRRELADIAEQLTRSAPKDRISLERAAQLLAELKSTEQKIEQIQQGLPAAS